MMADALIIGCGISGATVARELAERGFHVTVLERRNHIGGNMSDYTDSHGFLVHRYGPHIFHTSDESVWRFVNRFSLWQPFTLVCGAFWDGKYTPTAFNFTTIDTFYPPEYATLLKTKLLQSFPGRESASVVELLSHPDPDISGYAQYLFDNDYALYTAKQWGIPASEIDPSVLKRVPIRFSYAESYFTDTYEAMPDPSYTAFFQSLLDHPNIRTELNSETKNRLFVSGDSLLFDGQKLSVPVIYTGALDELFSYRFGELPYRSLRFEWKFSDVDSFQDAPVVAYPKAVGYTRITEYKKLPPQTLPGTSYAVEYPLPFRPGQNQEPYYPVLTKDSQNMYEQYRHLAEKIPNLFPCGRLADFRYYNMDQALAHALEVSRSI